jgi:hypothetical protein
MYESDQKVVVLNADQKVSAVKAASDILHAVAFIKEMVSKETLTEEMRDTMCGLLDHYIVEFCEPLGFYSKASERIEAQHAEIRELNGKIHELERQLGKAAPIDTVPNLLRNLRDGVSDWWVEQGFGWIRKFTYGPYGSVQAEFSFSFDHVFTGSKTPVSDKKAKESTIELLEKQGFIFVVDERDHRLLDCDMNRKLLMDLLTVRFPSIQIQYWENRSVRKTNNFALWGINAVIMEIRDLEGGVGNNND